MSSPCVCTGPVAGTSSRQPAFERSPCHAFTPRWTHLATLALLPLAGLSPAHAEVVVDCAGGAVTIDQSVEVVTVTGVCTDVLVSGSNSAVTVPDATSLTITGSNTEVTSGALVDLVVSGSNVVVSTPSATRVTISGGNSNARIAGSVEPRRSPKPTVR